MPGPAPKPKQQGGANGGSFAQKQSLETGVQNALSQPNVTTPSAPQTRAPSPGSWEGQMWAATHRPPSPPQSSSNQNDGGSTDTPAGQLQSNYAAMSPRPSTGGASEIQQRMRPNAPRAGAGGGIGPSQNSPYYNPSLPGTGGGNYNTTGASFGNDPSGRINQMNPNASEHLPYVQGGTTGGFYNGQTTIGAGRSITPEQYQAQIAQARAAGVPDEYIQAFLRGNPGDSNRLLEGYASESGGKYAGAMENAQRTPWQDFQTAPGVGTAPQSGIGPQGLTPGVRSGTGRMTGTQGRLGYRPPTNPMTRNMY